MMIHGLALIHTHFYQRIKLWSILHVTIHWNAVDKYFIVVLFVSQCQPICYFGTFINFGLGTVKSERVNDSGRINHSPPSAKRITVISFSDVYTL